MLMRMFAVWPVLHILINLICFFFRLLYTNVNQYRIKFHAMIFSVAIEMYMCVRQNDWFQVLVWCSSIFKLISKHATSVYGKRNVRTNPYSQSLLHAYNLDAHLKYTLSHSSIDTISLLDFVHTTKYTTELAPLSRFMFWSK